jgi:hypothetical protein
MLSGWGLLSNHVAAVIVPAGRADVMGALTFAAVRALHVPDRLQGVVGAAHVATRLRGFLFRDGHRSELPAIQGIWEGGLISEIAGRSKG